MGLIIAAMGNDVNAHIANNLVVGQRLLLFLNIKLKLRANYAIVADKAAQDFCRWQGA
jgi:hypothetical protein